MEKFEKNVPILEVPYNIGICTNIVKTPTLIIYTQPNQTNEVRHKAIKLIGKNAEEKKRADKNWKAREGRRQAEEKVSVAQYRQNIENISMRVRRQKQKELECIGCSEAIRKRVDQKLKKLEVDKFFYGEQDLL